MVSVTETKGFIFQKQAKSSGAHVNGRDQHIFLLFWWTQVRQVKSGIDSVMTNQISHFHPILKSTSKWKSVKKKEKGVVHETPNFPKYALNRCTPIVLQQLEYCVAH